jgi:hypothetical protein
MLILFTMLSVIAALAIFPGWNTAKKWHKQSLWLLALPLAGNAFWLLLTVLNIGVQSLANIIEVFAVNATAIVASYLKFYVFDRRPSMGSLGMIIAVAIVAAITLGLRLFMPLLPE